MKPLVIYHANCMDGAGAALAAWLKFGEQAEYRPANYGDLPPSADQLCGGREVYVLDFSYKRADMIRVAENVLDAPRAEWLQIPKSLSVSERYEILKGPYSGKLVVLDHHATAQKELVGLPFCEFDMNRSGAAMAWEHFHGRELPQLIRYIQDRDLWKWELPHSREVSAALALCGGLSDFRNLIGLHDYWNRQLEKDGILIPEYLVQDGSTVLRVEKAMVERIAASAEEVEIPFRYALGEFRVRALAASSPVLQSEVGEALAFESAKAGRDAVGAVYYRDGKAEIWRVSLRSRDAFGGSDGHSVLAAPDVSEIARSHGGGGHRQAAGFECRELPWKKKTP